MANLKITELPEQTATPAADDMYVVVDVSDPVPTNMTKKIRSDKVHIHGAAQLATGVVTGTKLADGAVIATKIGAGAVIAGKIATGGVSAAAQIADDVIDSQHYVDGSIDTQHIGDLQITTAKIAAGTNGQTLMTGVSGAAWMTHINPAHYTSTSWDGDAKSAGTYDLNLNTVFGVPTGVKAVLVRASAKWAEASDGSFMEVKYSAVYHGIVMRALVANFNIDAYGLLFVPANGVIRVEIGGANSLATTVGIEGYLL